MKITYTFFLIIFLLFSCNNSAKKYGDIEVVSRALMGLIPAENYQCDSPDSETFLIEFVNKEDLIVEWIYSWQIAKNNFAHIQYYDYRKNLLREVNERGYYIFNRDSVDYKLNGVENLYSVKCTFTPEKNHNIKCSVRIFRLK